MDSFKKYLTDYQQIINEMLFSYVRDYTYPGRLQEAMLYSIEAGGKRIRPVLLLSTMEALGAQHTRGYSVACALEMIHTYSLIHDDLPAMDDDDIRRGQATNHQAFDEATAILAGDALLTLSFQVITEDVNLTSEEKVYLVRELSKASGGTGMVAGQMEDMLSENKQISIDVLKSIHVNKTGRLLSFAITAGAYLSHPSDQSLGELTKIANVLGLIFQIQDDILDVAGDAGAIGKPVGSDEVNSKSTYPKILGMEGAIKEKEQYVDIALQSLDKAGVNATSLSRLIGYLSSRDR
ncbi:polyprenyl synthetase family protein [Halobacillus shinanisalinarum]|uniref:Polyprenyl synthetase family protein n=1 Tax=Halobacillus shinanisalinarum TaxID=2932258 RepID=A0ABY4H039_9BACI|nr:farnesyl diphosphate synthase [Halobacillus shinanisalinarum]UOQ93694.1 polyprenyl synthetase family protein [Halobacillus shinanisalinarum]